MYNGEEKTILMVNQSYLRIIPVYPQSIKVFPLPPYSYLINYIYNIYIYSHPIKTTSNGNSYPLKTKT
jgi:hypothetical protein